MQTKEVAKKEAIEWLESKIRRSTHKDKEKIKLTIGLLEDNMNNLTRNGVAKDLANSPYIYTVITENDVLHLYFSSKLHMKRFSEKRNKNYNMIYNYIYKRFKYQIDCRLLADLNLYQKIETRGFYVRLNKEVYLCPNNIILNGENKTKKSYAEWCETLTTNSGD